MAPFAFKFAHNCPVWLKHWAQTIGSLNPQDAAANQVHQGGLAPLLQKVLINEEACRCIDAADRNDPLDRSPVRSGIERDTPVARHRERREAMCWLLFQAALLLHTSKRGASISASATKERERLLAKHCRTLARDLSTALPFSPSSTLEYLQRVHQIQQDLKQKRAKLVHEILEKLKRRKITQQQAENHPSLRPNEAPLPDERFTPGFNLPDVLNLYAALLDRDVATPLRRRRATGRLAARNFAIDLLIVSAQKTYFSRVPNSLIAAILSALSDSPVGESVVRARAVALRK